jgi:hypothetical protein
MLLSFISNDLSLDYLIMKVFHESNYSSENRTLEKAQYLNLKVIYHDFIQLFVS